MASRNKKAAAKSSVKFKDLKSKRNPKGGAFNAYVPKIAPKIAPVIL